MITGIIKGVSAYLRAFGVISKLKLWKFFAVPMLISLVLAMIIGFITYGISDNIGAYLGSFWPWEWGQETFETIASVFGGLLIIAIGLILFKNTIMAISAPFVGPISKKIEVHMMGKDFSEKESSSWELLARGTHVSIKNLIKELLWTVTILLIGLIPVVGVVSAILLFLVQSYYAGFGNMDVTLERHFNYRESVRFVRKNRGLAIGNGMLFILCLLIPILGVIIVLPLSITSATIITVEKIQQEKIL